MDVTLNKVRGKGQRAIRARNFRAWRNNFANPDMICRYCTHNNEDHLVSSGQPHFFDARGRRKVVARNAELIRAFCVQCAKDIGTSQVACYIRTTGIGEQLPIKKDNHE